MPVTTGVTAGPVVKQTLPVITVPADVLLRVLETTPNGANEPRFGAVWANAEADTTSSATRASLERYAILLIGASVAAVSWRRKELARLASKFIFFLGYGDALNSNRVVRETAKFARAFPHTKCPTCIGFALCGNTHTTSRARSLTAICFMALTITSVLNSKCIRN